MSASTPDDLATTFRSLARRRREAIGDANPAHLSGFTAELQRQVDGAARAVGSAADPDAVAAAIRARPPTRGTTPRSTRCAVTPSTPAPCCAGCPRPPLPRPVPTMSAERSRIPWWREAVIYQVYVRSFADADGDGLGDLAGIRSRLPYLRRLGVDAIWLNPCYPSPQADAGYDVADYRDIDPRFGTLADMDGLLADAHALGLRVIMDIVPNHTSDEHAWFEQALAAGPGSRERARYVFRDGRGPGGAQPPNDWQSTFGGPAWTRVTEADGTARPVVPAPVRHQAAGPRLARTTRSARSSSRSCASGSTAASTASASTSPTGWRRIRRCPTSPAEFAAGGPAAVGHPHWDLDEVHDVYRRWREISDEYDGERAYVAEVWVQTAERLARYLRPDELHTAFNFHLLLAPWDAAALREAIDTSIDALDDVGAPPTWVLSNHDVVRHVTRYGDGQARQAAGPRGRAADAGAARWGLRLPGRGARTGRGDRPPRRGAPGPGVPPHRRQGHRPRRLPGADPVVGDVSAVRVRSRHGPAMAAPTARVGRA